MLYTYILLYRCTCITILQYSHLHSLSRVVELGITVSLDTATGSVDVNADAIYIRILLYRCTCITILQYSHLHSLGRVVELGITVSLDTAIGSVDTSADAIYVYIVIQMYMHNNTTIQSLTFTWQSC